MFQVSDLYDNAKHSGTKLLSDYTAPFWSAYNDDHERFDALFNRKYSSFRYFNQKDGQSLDEVTANFISDVYIHLLINTQKYNELYRIESIDDEDYNIKYNYTIKEKTITDRTNNKTIVLGSRHDESEDTQGARTDTTTTQYGEVVNTTDSSTDAITNTNSNKVSPYDGLQTSGTESLYTKDSSIDNLGETHSESTDTIEARTDSVNLSKGSQINNSDFTKGEETDTNNDVFHEQIDFNREGNIGTITVDDMLAKHKSFWKPWKFYDMIFNDICEELLLV